jgi:hypothetical protein
VIHSASGAGASIFIVDPRGVDILDGAPSPDGLKDGMKLALQNTIIGASPPMAGRYTLGRYRGAHQAHQISLRTYDLQLCGCGFVGG